MEQNAEPAAQAASDQAIRPAGKAVKENAGPAAKSAADSTIRPAGQAVSDNAVPVARSAMRDQVCPCSRMLSKYSAKLTKLSKVAQNSHVHAAPGCENSALPLHAAASSEWDGVRGIVLQDHQSLDIHADVGPNFVCKASVDDAGNQRALLLVMSMCQLIVGLRSLSRP